MREKDYFQFYNTKMDVELDPIVSRSSSSGSLLEGNGLKVVAYTSRKKGRRNSPKKLSDTRRLVRGVLKFSDTSLDDAFESTFIPKGRWTVLCLTAKVRRNTGDYKVRYELELDPQP